MRRICTIIDREQIEKAVPHLVDGGEHSASHGLNRNGTTGLPASSTHRQIQLDFFLVLAICRHLERWNRLLDMLTIIQLTRTKRTAGTTAKSYLNWLRHWSSPNEIAVIVLPSSIPSAKSKNTTTCQTFSSMLPNSHLTGKTPFVYSEQGGTYQEWTPWASATDRPPSPVSFLIGREPTTITMISKIINSRQKLKRVTARWSPSFHSPDTEKHHSQPGGEERNFNIPKVPIIKQLHPIDTSTDGN